MKKVSAAKNPDKSMPTGVSYLIGRLDRLLRRRLGEVLSPQGLTVQQYTALAVLDARGQLSNAQLAERSFVTPQTANEMVKGMESRGWIERSADPTHGRIIHLRLTRAGRAILNKGHSAAAELEQIMLDRLPQTERDHLLGNLKICAQAVGAMIVEGGE
jgi:DNA-binding MarR family transcriptional regulator